MGAQGRGPRRVHGHSAGLLVQVRGTLLIVLALFNYCFWWCFYCFGTVIIILAVLLLFLALLLLLFWHCYYDFRGDCCIIILFRLYTGLDTWHSTYCFGTVITILALLYWII